MSDIKFGGIRKGSAVVDNTMSVGGGIKIGGGGSAPVVVDARWGQILGDIQNQIDLMNALALKADSSDLANYATESELSNVSAAVATKASASDLTALSNTVATKLTTPSGTEGQFLVYHNGSWQGQTMSEWEGGNY